jgi:hypothetical protein
VWCGVAAVLQVVQVYTYMLNPLGVGGDDSNHPRQGQPTAAAAAAAPAGAPGGDGKQYSKITGWELKLVLELCNSVSSLAYAGPGSHRAHFVRASHKCLLSGSHKAT